MSEAESDDHPPLVSVDTTDEMREARIAQEIESAKRERDENFNLKIEIERLHTVIKTMTFEEENLRDQLNNSERDRKIAYEKIKDLDDELNQEKEKKEDAETDLKVAVTKWEAIVKSLEKSVEDSTSAELEESRAEVKEMKMRLESAMEEAKQGAIEMSELKEQMKEMLMELEKMNESGKPEEGEIRDVCDLELTTRVSQLTKELKEEKEKNMKIEEMRKDLKSEFDKMETELERAEKRYAELDKHRAQLEAELDYMVCWTNGVRENEVSFDSVKGEVQLEAELERVPQKMEEHRLEAKTVSIEELNVERADLNADLEKLMKSEFEFREKCKELEKEIEDLKERYSDARIDEIISNSEQMAEMKGLNDEYVKKIQELEAGKEVLLIKLEESNEKIRVSTAISEELSRENTELSERLTKSESELTNLLNRYEELKKDAVGLNERLEEEEWTKSCVEKAKKEKEKALEVEKDLCVVRAEESEKIVDDQVSESQFLRNKCSDLEKHVEELKENEINLLASRCDGNESPRKRRKLDEVVETNPSNEVTTELDSFSGFGSHLVDLHLPTLQWENDRLRAMFDCLVDGREWTDRNDDFPTADSPDASWIPHEPF